MADYTEILDDELLPDAPITSLLGFRLRDNPVAIAQAASGAPRAVPASLKAPGVNSGAIIGTTWVGFTGLGAIKQIRFDMSADNTTTASGTTFDVAFSSDGGSTWGASQGLATVSSNECLFLSGHVDLATGASTRVGYRWGPSSSLVADASAATTLTVPANCNAIRFRFAAGARVGRIYITPIGGRE